MRPLCQFCKKIQETNFGAVIWKLKIDEKQKIRPLSLININISLIPNKL